MSTNDIIYQKPKRSDENAFLPSINRGKKRIKMAAGIVVASFLLF